MDASWAGSGRSSKRMETLPVGVIGTSWWADAMYLPALKASPLAEMVAVAGRNRTRAEAFAEAWGIPRVFTDHQEMLASDLCRAIVVATPNDSHYPIAMAAMERGLHVLCEKPLGLNYRQAAEMAVAAQAQGVTTLVPFTYRYMPTTRYLKELVDDGYLGRPHHLNLRYFSRWALPGQYAWRMDVGRAGSGVLGDLGSHFLHLAEWFFGEIEEVSCRLDRLVERPSLDPEGRTYEQADDVAVVVLSFRNGAQGVVHASAVAHEDTPFGQLHEMDLHGSEGSLHHTIDWDRVQVVRGARVGEGAVRELPVPDRIWGGAPRSPVKDTYHHVFRTQGRMVGEFVAAAAQGRPIRPDFGDGARVQRVIDAALRSQVDGRRVSLSEVSSTQPPPPG